MPEPPEEIAELAERRARARAAKDFREADAIRERIASAGWTIEDEPGGGSTLTPAAAPEEDVRIRAGGPFGVVTTDLRQFGDAPGPGPCDAVEGYLMAFRREIVTEAGFFDEKFTWYRTADIEWSFRVKDAGYRCEVVDVPIVKHE